MRTGTGKLIVTASVLLGGFLLPSCAPHMSQPRSSTASSAEQQTGLSVVESIAQPIGEVLWAMRTTQVLRSGDGGRSWVDVTPPNFSSALGDFVLDDDQAYVADSSNSGSIQVFVTRDGGVIWKAKSLTVEDAAGGPGSVFIAMADEDNGLLSVETAHGASTAEVELFRTKDGGGDWHDLGLRGLLGPISFSDRTTAWAPAEPEGQSLLRSDDGGETWNVVRLSLPDSSDFTTIGVPSFYASDGALPVMSGQTLLTLTTLDAGSTWTLLTQTLTDPNAAIPAAFVPFDLADSSHIYVGFNGGLLQTGLDDSKWGQLSLPGQGIVSDVDGFGSAAAVIIQQSSCAKTDESCYLATTVAETEDGGASWTVENPPPVTKTA
jgi:photosystem II stability/assembly factor-like uncharacterized protein